MDSAGHLLSTFELRDPPADWVSCWRADAGGRLWASDRDHLFAFELDGRLRDRLGGRMTADEFQSVGQIAIDARGEIGLVDARTQRLHVFAATGEPLASPSDSWEVLGVNWHSVFERATPGWRHDKDQNCVTKLDAAGDIALRLERRFDGRFFRVVRAIAVGADGALAVLETPPYFDHDGPCSVSLFSREGAALRTMEFRTPDGALPSLLSVDMGEQWLLVSNYDGTQAVLVPRTDGAPVIVDLVQSSRAQPANRLAFSPDQSELWQVDYAPPTLHRYALPAK
jgi:hypothetical protein